MQLCGAKTRAGTPCKHEAGWGTQYSGVWRCKMHGGSEPHARVNGMVELARRERTALGAPMDIEPQDGILECIRIAAGEVREASDRIPDLAPEDIETLATWSTIRHEAMESIHRLLLRRPKGWPGGASGQNRRTAGDADRSRRTPERREQVRTTTDYLIDSVLVLLVLLQIRERTLTTKTLIRPLLIVGIAVANYLRGVPTAGNDLVLVAILAIVGGAIGLASAQTVIMRGGPDGEVLARAGWASAFFWVLGMGSRFAFIFWITHSGAASIADFSVQHAITGSAWTVALLAMAVCEVVARSALMAARRRRLHGRRAFEFA